MTKHLLYTFVFLFTFSGAVNAAIVKRSYTGDTTTQTFNSDGSVATATTLEETFEFIFSTDDVGNYLAPFSTISTTSAAINYTSFSAPETISDKNGEGYSFQMYSSTNNPNNLKFVGTMKIYGTPGNWNLFVQQMAQVNNNPNLHLIGTLKISDSEVIRNRQFIDVTGHVVKSQKSSLKRNITP